MFYILNNTCSDPILARYLALFDDLLSILQILVPIVLIVGLTIEVTKLVINPDEKKSPKTIVNRIIAALIFFFLPMFVDIVLNLVGEFSGEETFQIVACWEDAKLIKADLDSSEWTYYEVESSSNYEALDFSGARRPVSSNISVGDNDKAQEVVDYALQFLGNPYIYGGNDINNGIDCSAFVGYVYNHFGITLPRTTYGMEAAVENLELQTVDASEARASDLVLYDGHVAMLTGNGNEIVHAKGEIYGIVVDSDYNYGSKKAKYFIRLV